jgi:hypothetical protein
MANIIIFFRFIDNAVDPFSKWNVSPLRIKCSKNHS